MGCSSDPIPGDEFIDALASSAPTPGGGGASAYVGAVASALASMVGELTVGKPKYAAVQDDMEASLSRLGSLREELLGLIDADAEAFLPLQASYGMPAGDEAERAERDQAKQEALGPAIEVPLSIMERCSDVIAECRIMADEGSRLAISDAGACAAIAKGALVAASMNVWVNVRDVADAEKAAAYRDRAGRILEDGIRQADAIEVHVLGALGAPQRIIEPMERSMEREAGE